MTNKRCVVIGGGTFNHVRCHLSVAAPAFGETARRLHALCEQRFPPTSMDVDLVLTKMADPSSPIVTNDDLSAFVDTLVESNLTKVVFFNAAVADFTGQIGAVASGKRGARLSSARGEIMYLDPYINKIVGKLRRHRKDIFVVAFKTTCGATPSEQYRQALGMLKRNSINLVLANDLETRVNFIVTPEEGVIHGERDQLLGQLVDMAWARSHLSFTRSTVVDGVPVPWTDLRVPSNLRGVINWLVEQGAYREFNGATTGHFATKLGAGHFLTSIRKTNFNQIATNGMVEVRTQGDDEVIAFGARPSVGGQSQRAIFEAHPALDCIVHFHCPLRSDRRNHIPVMSQWEYECGSHECGQNTRDGLARIGNLHAVMLDNHGPNIVFAKDVDPQEVIDFITANFDLSQPTNGFVEAYGVARS